MTSVRTRIPRTSHHLLAILAVALFVRLAVFDAVAVNGDTGLYLYDAKQILWGGRLYIDFPSRSPLFHYLLAPWVAAFDSPIVAGRSMMIAIGLLTTTAVYALTRHLHSHRAAVIAAILYAVTPFSVTWGLWVKTEQLSAMVTMIASLYILRVIDRDHFPTCIALASGVLFGIAFLIRRSVLVTVGAIGIFIVLYRYDELKDITGSVRTGVLMVASSLATLLLAYWLLAHGSLDNFLAITDQHLVGLFTTNGHGGIEWIYINQEEAVTHETRTHIIYQICQKCGLLTVEVINRTLLVTAPVFVLLSIMLRSYTRLGDERLADYLLPGVFVAGGLSQIGILAIKHYYIRIAAILVAVAVTIYVWRAPPVDWEDLWRPKLGLPIAVLLALAAGYLHRDRILYVTYFQDFYPWLVVVAGVSLTAYLDTIDYDYTNPLPELRRPLVLTGVVIFTASFVIAAGFTYPLQPGGVPPDTHWFSVNNMQDYGDDIEARTDPGDRILTSQPLYAVEADRKIAGNMSRRYYVYQGWPDTSARKRVDSQVRQEIRDGEVALVIKDNEYQVLKDSKQLQRLVDRCYRHEPTVLYPDTGAKLYVPTEDYPECAQS